MNVSLVRRWLRFNFVGLLGIFVQLGALAVLKETFGIHYLAATALAVEAAVLHNFLWHKRWTWRDRTRGDGLTAVTVRLLRFNFSTGLVSIVANVALMRVLAGWLHLHYLAANIVTIAICSLANFAASEWFAFGPARVSAPMIETAAPPAQPFPRPR